MISNDGCTESEKLAAASRLKDDVSFYQTVDANVAKLFHINPDVKRPALVLLKKDAEKVTHYVICNFKGFNMVAQTFEDAAKLFKGKLIFVFVELDNEDVGKPVADYFGITGDAPQF
ncbi:hypothetical protein QVD17_23371 [Tagetes erecta]|uniref:Uncharacterized protein n=1 Tax=Tagetes erecta TaxID=13708 RepID=A0AAD8NU87_TARER|nr:hypothetical protein QVD17_23371 [Tagetes erecta]